MARVYGYLARDVRFNNPVYLVWKSKPVGQVTFKTFTKVMLLKPTKSEEKRLKHLANQKQEPCFVVKLEGARVYLNRSALLTEEEYNERRNPTNTKHYENKQKLALLKKRKGGVGKG